MIDRIRLAAAAVLLSVPLTARAQNDVGDVRTDSAGPSTPSLLPATGPAGTAAPLANRAELPVSTPRAFVRDPAGAVQMPENRAVSRGPSLPDQPNVSHAASFRPHDPIRAAEQPGPRREISPDAAGVAPHGRRVSDVRDAADRIQIRQGSREVANGERDMRRGRLLIQEGEKPGHDRRLAAEGAALERRGFGEVLHGSQVRSSGANDLQRDRIAAHRVGMGPTPGRRTEERRAYREGGHATYRSTPWGSAKVAHVKKKWGSE